MDGKASIMNTTHRSGKMQSDEKDNEHKLAMMEEDIAITKNMAKIKHKIAVMSGKGGVGKSTVSVNMALAFNQKGYHTGILDADLHGPNIPLMLGLEGRHLNADEQGILPVVTEENIKVMSIAFLLPSKASPVIWRGPKKTGAIRQFLGYVAWDELDLLIVDNPPGTGDEPLTVLQSIPSLDGIVIVTTPSPVALEDVEKCVAMAKSLNIPVIGIIENMSGFVCPECGEESFIFGSGGGKRIAAEMDVPFLGQLPINLIDDPDSDENMRIITPNNDSLFTQRIMEVVDKIEEYIKKKDE
jgi:ATP-binding protein involved in chromosome partitioning